VKGKRNTDQVEGVFRAKPHGYSLEGLVFRLAGAGTIRPMVDSPRFRLAVTAVRWGVVMIVLIGLLLGSLLPGGVPVMPERPISLPLGIVLMPRSVSPPMKHLIVFGFLGFFLVLALQANWRRAGLVAGGLAMFGLVIEMVQIPIPGRSFLWVDAGASAAGAVGGAVMGVVVRWFVR